MTEVAPLEMHVWSDDEVLTATEAAALLKVSSKTVLRLARDGELPAQKVGRAWRFCRSELLTYVAGADRQVVSQ